ncbi:chromate transporter [Enterocloster clostridioformis]|uniref:chromate transporter n=1 Tax=Enterocloster clostridioformis TaxID=1531 RepID=UPI00080CBD20|nr:chromate transporter [Enterocloster clostridioformis]ANU46585.1 chromate transporter [Lachnoclostridium sp. YL32]NDO31443.1 chromate transporter [Enterocloster clostridioformis]OXE65295.1 chromate transporter [Enterocloster clostridioformis]QQQ98701.1 chromate transporter [Enterocloster clostridioformis]
MIYFQLFLSFLQIGAFSFGGGYAAMPLIQNQVVTLHGWLNPAEFTDLVTISQMTPGPIAINAATFVGTRIAGTPGALAATIGCVLPSCILVTLLAKIYLKYRNLSLIQGVLKSLRPAVVAMIGAAGVSILVTAFWGLEGFSPDLSAMNPRSVCIFIGAMILLIRFKMNPILVMVLSGLAETACQLAMRVI